MGSGRPMGSWLYSGEETDWRILSIGEATDSEPGSDDDDDDDDGFVGGITHAIGRVTGTG